MPTGQERMVLAACDELADHGHGFVLASNIAGNTGLSPGAVKDRLLGLDRDGFVEIATLGNGDLTASVTPKGREELAKYTVEVGTPIPEPRKERQIKVVPKGLRSYDEHDAEFFLELLPGPRRTDGLPESIHYWKTRIEEMDPDRTFRVGLIYGPSGCGKSSFVKAGLLPRLAGHIQTIYVEATAEDIEARLLKELRKRFPDLLADLGLVKTMAALCSGQAFLPGKKLLIVLDQFEQWLHAKSGEEDTELVAALRLCDGGYVQALVLVRDDFWLETNRFETRVGVVFRRDYNSYGVDLFDQRHAKKVLASFGRAYGALEDQVTDDQKEFLNQAVEGLAQGGKIIPVRIALLAEMLKSREWTKETLKEVGGTEGVGVAFLEETFGAQHADPRYRRHRRAVEGIFKALLPEIGTAVSSRLVSKTALMLSSGYQNNDEYFNELIDILEKEIKIINHLFLESVPEFLKNEKFYKFSHDFIVEQVRTWLLTNYESELEYYNMIFEMKYDLCKNFPNNYVALDFEEVKKMIKIGMHKNLDKQRLRFFQFCLNLIFWKTVLFACCLGGMGGFVLIVTPGINKGQYIFQFFHAMIAVITCVIAYFKYLEFKVSRKL